MNIKKGILLLFLLILTLILTSCGNTNPNSTTVSFIPNFDLAQISHNLATSKIIIPPPVSPSDDTLTKVSFFCFTPALLNFTKNTTTISNGAQLTFHFLNTDLNVTVSIDNSTNIVTYQGVLADHSGTITINYNTTTNRFNYDQYIILQDPTGAYFGDKHYAIVSITLNDVAVTNEGYFHVITHAKCLEPTHFFVVDCDYYSGLGKSDHPNSAGHNIAGFYCYKMWVPVTEVDPNSLPPDPLTITKTDFDNQFAQIDQWLDANNRWGEKDLFIYYDFNAGHFYSKNGYIATQANSLPWDKLQ